MDAMLSLGERIRAAREENGLTQKDLAILVETSQEVIHAYESGKRGSKRPDIYMLVRISKVLDVTLDDLFQVS